ncbi:ubiquitin 3 binding protein But2 C-terminal domain-containing protein [Hypoxylon cercidicola]|nr:ubiquitin 3 binding protein But2 C-terminal domain-containing protein [Hypoxylon cercidicola]
MLLSIFSTVFLTSLGSATGVPLLRIDATCGFRLTTEGSFSGKVGQLTDGQVRAGSDLAQSLFTWFGDAFADQQGRGCWWTPPTSVLQCDWGQPPDHGFEIGCYGAVSYCGQEIFYECQTDDGDEVDIYLQPNGANCSRITLHTDSCRRPCEGESSALPNPTGTQATATPSSTPRTCDIVVADGPDEIVLIDRGNPDTAYGANPSMTVQLSANASAIFVFRFAASDAGKQCALAFDLPSAQDPRARYRLAGGGPVGFALLQTPPADPAHATYANRPRVAMPLASAELRPGMSVQPLAFPCPGAEAEVAFLMADEVGADACLEYQQYRPEVPMGLYLVKC